MIWKKVKNVFLFQQNIVTYFCWFHRILLYFRNMDWIRCYKMMTCYDDRTNPHNHRKNHHWNDIKNHHDHWWKISSRLFTTPSSWFRQTQFTPLLLCWPCNRLMWLWGGWWWWCGYEDDYDYDDDEDDYHDDYDDEKCTYG